MKTDVITILIVPILLAAATVEVEAGLAVGAAPKGDPVKVASKIIKYNFPSCKRVSQASRSPDGSIRAKCDGTDYLVFTVFNAKEGKTLEIAMNCTVAKDMLKVSC